MKIGKFEKLLTMIKGRVDMGGDPKINPNELDVECLIQPQMMSDYSDLAALAELLFDEAEREYKLIRAKSADDYRRQSENAGTRVTDRMVENYVDRDAEVLEALKVVNRSRYYMNLMIGRVKAMHQRKAALENLVHLHKTGMFSTPRTREASQTEHLLQTRQTKRNMVNDAVAEALIDV